MGDRLLIKKTVYITVLFMTYLYADVEMNKIKMMIEKIHEKRKGVDLKNMESIKEPFMELKKQSNITISTSNENNENSKFFLHAIMNGKAYINNGWKSVGDKISGFTLKFIGNKGVVLQDGNQIKKLLFNKKKFSYDKRKAIK
jgi:hypothetical protein